MSIQNILADCQKSGVAIQLIGGALKLRGEPGAVQAAASKLRPHKAAVLEYLQNGEAWGPYTPYCCPVSPELVQELHRLIAEYAALYRLSDEATSRIIETAKRQAAASVPESVAYFKSKIKEKS